MTVISRVAEQKELKDMLSSKEAEFLVLYGRRRIGKSYLIENYFQKKSCLFFHVTGIQKGKLTEQLAEFGKEIGKIFYKGATIASPASWMAAFEELTKAINNQDKNKKVILFFDEFPWMSTHKSRLIQAVDYYWNRYWKNDVRIKLIVCGSSASWIIRKILHNKGGLHNRNTRTILLRPFNLQETKLFLEAKGVKTNHEQTALIYMFCGGVPYYLNYIKKSRSHAQSIDKMCFQQNGVLYNEFDKLFDSLFEDSKIYKALVRAIAKTKEGVSRSAIEENVKSVSKGGTLSERLKELEDACFIKSFVPLGHKRQGIYYKVIDEYCYFYLKWIEPAKNTLLAFEDNNQYWSSKLKTPEYYSWLGLAFELVCYKQISAIRKALDINITARVGGWRYVPAKGSGETGVQIDLIFIRDDGITMLCEIKYSNKPFLIDKSYAENLTKKIQVYKKRTQDKNQIQLVFISANGLQENKYFHQLVDGVVTLEDLFSN